MRCRGCGKEFKPTHGNQVYCSKLCAINGDADNVSQRCKEYYAKNREKLINRSIAYQRDNKEKVNEKRRIRYKRKKDERDKNQRSDAVHTTGKRWHRTLKALYRIVHRKKGPGLQHRERDYSNNKRSKKEDKQR